MNRALIFVYAAWTLALMEPDWYLTKTIGGPFFRIPTLILPILIVVAVANRRRESLSWPFVIFVLLHLWASIFAENAGFARLPFKFLLHMYALYASTVALINTPKRLETLFKIYLVSFFWYGAQGVVSGRVGWHPLLSNQDSFGPLMGMGIGFAYYYAQSTESKTWRMFSYLVCAIGLVGVVTSFARGATLSAAAVLVLIWVRSPRKLAALGAGFVAAVVLLVAIQVAFPDGEFWAEMATVSEGADSGTGQARWVMWQMAWPVFLESPILGVGAFNFGVVASEIIPFDPSRPKYTNPSNLYGMTLHSVYVSLMAEEGLVGIGCWIVFLFGFASQLRFLRMARVAAAYARHSGSTLDITSTSRGLELAMVGYLVSAVFYNQMYIHWFWTLLALARAASSVAAQSSARARRHVHSAATSEPTHPSPRDAGREEEIDSPPRSRSLAANILDK